MIAPTIVSGIWSVAMNSMFNSTKNGIHKCIDELFDYFKDDTKYLITTLY